MSNYPRFSDGSHYIVCPACGIGLGRNFLKAQDPVWIHCDECAKHHGVDRSTLPISEPIKWHKGVAHRWKELTLLQPKG